MKIIDKVLEDKELLKKTIIINFCPKYFDFKSSYCKENNNSCDNTCIKCWNKEIEEIEDEDNR